MTDLDYRVGDCVRFVDSGRDMSRECNPSNGAVGVAVEVEYWAMSYRVKFPGIKHPNPEVEGWWYMHDELEKVND